MKVRDLPVDRRGARPRGPTTGTQAPSVRPSCPSHAGTARAWARPPPRQRIIKRRSGSPDPSAWPLHRHADRTASGLRFQRGGKNQGEGGRSRGKRPPRRGRHSPPTQPPIPSQHGTRPRRAAAEAGAPVPSRPPFLPGFLPSRPHPSAARRESTRQTPQNHRTAPPAHAAAAVGDDAALPSRSFHRGGAAHARGPTAAPHRLLLLLLL